MPSSVNSERTHIRMWSELNLFAVNRIGVKETYTDTAILAKYVWSRKKERAHTIELMRKGLVSAHTHTHTCINTNRLSDCRRLISTA